MRWSRHPCIFFSAATDQLFSGALEVHTLPHCFLLPCPQAHRLDDATGGLLLVGKTQEALRTLCACFAGRGVAKRYQALAWGRLEGHGLVRHTLDGKPSETEYLAVAHSMVLGRCGCASNSGGSSSNGSASASASGSSGSASAGASASGDMVWTAGSLGAEGKESAEGLASEGTYTARAARAASGPSGSSGGGCGCPPQWATTLELWPHTGRMHQLRRHMALVGHPLVGDCKYTHGYRAQREAAGLHLNEEDHVRLGVEKAGGDAGPGVASRQQQRQEEEEEDRPAPLPQASAEQGAAAVLGAGGGGLHGSGHIEQQQEQQQQREEQQTSGGAAGSTSGVAAALASGQPGELCLWAVELQLPHPITGAPMHFQLEEPPLFEATRVLLAAGEQLPPGR